MSPLAIAGIVIAVIIVVIVFIAFVVSGESDASDYDDGEVAVKFYKLVNEKYGQAGNNDRVYNTDSAEDCATRCRDETEFDCRSFDYLPGNGSCYLSKSTVEKDSDYNKAYPGYQYYEMQ